MVKYFCDICYNEVDSPNALIKVEFPVMEECIIRPYRYSTCNDCRERLKNYISRIKEESKNGTT